MNKIYTITGIFGGTFLLVSFSTNPPDENTGAPGEMLCVQCHIQDNPSQDGTISLEGFPSSISPNETYMLTVINRLTTGSAIRAGFQVTILGPSNEKAGDMTNPSPSSAISITANRQYWDHNPALEYPDSNVVRWSVQWKAPALANGSSVTWYAAGNIADGNFSNIGDRIVTASGTGLIMLSSNDDVQNIIPVIYPNPGSNLINIKLADHNMQDGMISYYNIMGEKIGASELKQGMADASRIPPGIYLIEIKNNDRSHFVRWSKF